MSRFRASDEQIDREIDVLERIVRLRLRRAAAELRELDRDLRELRKERARRRSSVPNSIPATAPADPLAEGS